MAQVCPGAVFLHLVPSVRFDRVFGVLCNKATLCPYAARKTQGLARALPLDPWRNEGMARSRIIQIRVDDDEYDVLAQKGAAVGSMSRLLRDHLGKIQVRHRDDELQRLILLNRMNANLNMIARWANIHKSEAEAVQVQACLADVRREIGRLLVAMDRL
jgi:hypothetical protein